MAFDLSRRTALKGIMNGSAIAVGVPLLDVFLDGNGTAMAATVRASHGARARCPAIASTPNASPAAKAIAARPSSSVNSRARRPAGLPERSMRSSQAFPADM